MKQAALKVEGASTKRLGYLLWGSAKIALTYLGLAYLWILLSDAALLALAGEAGFRQLSPYKGIFFVTVTGILLFFLVKRFVSSLESDRKALEVSAAMHAEAELRLASILNTIPGFIYIKDSSFRYTFANKAVCDLVGLTQESIVGKLDFDLFSEETAHLLKKYDSEVLLEGRRVLREEINVLGPGQAQMVFMSIKIPLYDKDGRIYGLCGISSDITEAYAQKQALAESEARLQLAVAASKLVVLEYNSATKTLTRGGLCEEVLGLRAGEGPLEDLLPNIVDSDRELLIDSLKEAETSKRPFNIQIRIQRATGIFHIELMGSPQEREDGSKVLIGVGLDVTEDLRAAKESARAQLRRSALFEHAVDGVVMLDLHGTIIEANHSFSEMLAIESHYLIGKPISDWFSELAPERLKESRTKGSNLVEFEFEWLIPDKGVADIEVKALIGEFDDEELFICTCRDVTVSRDYERSLKQSEEQFRSLIESSPNGIILLDEKGLVRHVNRETERLLGYRREELLSRTGDDVLFSGSSNWQSGVFDHYWSDLRSADFGASREVVIQSKTGESLHIEVGITRIADSSGELMTLVTLVDATESWRAQDQIRKLAFYDELTSLPNRHSLIVTLDKMVEAATYSGQDFGLMLLDIDRFRDLNDGFGQDLGDMVLRLAADRIKEAIGSSYLLARVGGDDFALILWEGPQETLNLDAKAEAIMESFHEPIAVQGVQIFVTLSIGACACPRDGATLQILFGCLETSLYQAKKLGRGKYVRYTSDLGEKARAKHVTELELRRALKNEEFVLHYQPIIHLASDRIVGAEALIRWQHPERGLLGPAAFIETCEESNLIIPVGRWVMVESCRQAKAWQDEFDTSFHMSINFSAKQFIDANLVEDVHYAISQAGISAGTLQAEITESQLMDDPEAALLVLKELKGLGIKLAIDDFGTGYSSLGRLKSYPIDCLKVDRTFVQSVFEDQASEALCRSIVGLAHNLNLTVVAEGVETQEQEDFLRRLECEMTQGFLRGRPLGVLEFSKTLARSSDRVHD